MSHVVISVALIFLPRAHNGNTIMLLYYVTNGIIFLLFFFIFLQNGYVILFWPKILDSSLPIPFPLHLQMTTQQWTTTQTLRS